MAKLNEDFVKCRLDNVQNLQSAINYIFVLLGIKYTDQEQEERDIQTAVLIDFIRDRFGQLTVEEIKHAFKMYVSNELGIKKFRLLDCISASDVLNAFLEHRAEILRLHDSKKQILSLPTISEESKKEIVKNGITRVFNEFKESKDFGSNTVEYVFDELVSYGLIKLPNDPESKLAKWYEGYKQKATAIVMARAKQTENRSDKNKIINDIKNNTSSLVFSETKKLVLEQYFLKLIEDDADIETIIKFK